jgi:hypothetical protein
MSRPPQDLGDVIITLSRVQAQIRILNQYPTRYRRDGHFEAMVTALTTMQDHIDAWMEIQSDLERRQEERRQEERRHADRREQERRRLLATESS